MQAFPLMKSVLMAVFETRSCDSDCATQISHGSEILGSQHGEGENPGLETPRKDSVAGALLLLLSTGGL